MTPWVSRLVMANVVAFMFTASRIPMIMALVPVLIPVRPWTPFTYMFLHANMTHLLFNMLGLFFFGPRLEAKLGARRFLALYFLSGLGGALLSFFNPLTPVIGASGAVFGIFVAFAMYWPHEQILLMFVIPVPARVLVIFMTAIAVFGGLGKVQDGIAHFAHLGGFLGGFLYIKWVEARHPSKQFKRKLYENVSGQSLLQEAGAVRRWKSADLSRMHEINRDEYERLLHKLEADGVAALTLDEKAFLDRFSEVG